MKLLVCIPINLEQKKEFSQFIQIQGKAQSIFQTWNKRGINIKKPRGQAPTTVKFPAISRQNLYAVPQILQEILSKQIQRKLFVKEKGGKKEREMACQCIRCPKMKRNRTVRSYLASKHRKVPPCPNTCTSKLVNKKP